MIADFEKKQFIVQYSWVLLILLFFTLRLPYFLNDAFVPDEVWHLLHMRDIQNVGYFAIDNYQGHGSAFWYFGAALERLFGDSNTFFILRICSLLALTATAFFMAYSYRSYFNDEKYLLSTLLFTTFILTLPLFWWGGKLIFPEFFQCFLVTLAFYFIYIKKRFKLFAFFSLGFAFGLKLHVGPVIAFFIADNFFENFQWKKLIFFIFNLIALSLGFLICNPVLYENFPMFIENIRSNGHYFHFNAQTLIEHWQSVLTGRYPEWDLVYFGGIDKMAMPLINLILMAILIGWSYLKKQIRLSTIFIFLSSVIFSFTINERFLSYYAFTIIILTILLAMRVPQFNKNVLNGCLFIGIIFNMIATIPNVIENNVLATKMVDHLKNAEQHTACIASMIKDKYTNISVVINNTDVGANSSRIHFLIQSDLIKKSGLNKETPFANTSGIDLIPQITPKILSSFLKGQSEFLYLDGERTRRIARYADFIPVWSEFLSTTFHQKAELNIRFLGTCYGTRVSILSV